MGSEMCIRDSWGALFLRKLSCEVAFTRAGEVVFRASTWAGYLGVLTGFALVTSLCFRCHFPSLFFCFWLTTNAIYRIGMRPGAFSISINFRKSTDGGTVRDNFTNGDANQAMAVGFAVRHLLQSPKEYPDYDTARAFMETTPLMAPTYVILAGVKEGQGVSIARERSRVEETCTQVPECASHSHM